MEGTIWSLLPPIVAIALALLTKEVYLSLLIGILSGALLYTHFHVLHTVEVSMSIMGEKIGSNVNILIFLVFLGILVVLITRSGASAAYGEWAAKRIKSKKGSMFATMFLGILIFVDDYFNCLTVGTVMRPVTDRYGISRAKLAYLIDATAAPVCIIAPISSWAAAVGSSMPEDSGIDGLSLFMKTIPFNLYALLTILFMIVMIGKNMDFGTMRRYEERLQTEKEELAVGSEETKVTGHGGVLDLILPIVVLIVLCIGGMLYTGGIMEGKGIQQAFADCDSSLSLVLGSFFTLVFTFVLYLPRKILSFGEFCDSFVKGFQSMTSAIMILCLAWALSGICSDEYMNIGGFVREVVGGNAVVGALIPAIFFLVAVGLSFSTGTSWGTFGILIPIALAVVGTAEVDRLTLAVAAILAGAVCGDHISPISDTTILSSAGAQCNHLNHVSTQIPYALTVAACCLVGYLVGGILQSGWIALAVGVVLLILVLAVLAAKNMPRTDRR
ncbi:MAG TPA: Na+/H+ antiporter NhaC family protein [Candidatus Egerieimonas intestinavium]|uniref:Na+/H+ antiporter NhaC family protein n=1 Tax=Candidatus Egerieimonas intestinavium TaxID=2840777 RepID=A0A9D1EJ54_9FIRM|nr:Na+/H+ antiporter NhaC family protein [Candidatus Egerieimonas intestinavium]